MLLAACPPLLLGSSAVGIGATLVILGIMPEPDALASPVMTGAIVTGIGSVVSVVVSALISWQKIQAEMEKSRLETREREMERRAKLEQAEMDRKERMHDFRGKLDAATLQREALKIELETAKAQIALLRGRIEGHDQQIDVQRVDIDKNTRALSDSGTFPPVPAPIPGVE